MADNGLSPKAEIHLDSARLREDGWDERGVSSLQPAVISDVRRVPNTQGSIDFPALAQSFAKAAAVAPHQFFRIRNL